MSARVLAVGGTSLTFNGVTRSEVAWAKTGGGTSAFVAAPAYQAKLPAAVTKRRVADVALNADPFTGQYLVYTAPGKSVSYYSAGGTSISTPEWAGLLAIANAQRALAQRPVLTNVHAALYGVLANTATYGQAFLDVASGANGVCATCAAKSGYDAPTGLGSPNASSLLATLAVAVN